jgi:hypothetical protein
LQWAFKEIIAVILHFYLSCCKTYKSTNRRGILGQILLAGFQTTFVFFRLVEAFNCFISTPAHFSSKNNARAPHQDVQVPDRYRMACDQANRYTLMIPPPVEHDRANSS